MPSVSRKQRRFFGAELGRKKKGEATETGMSKSQLEDFASTKEAGLPLKVKKKKKAKAPHFASSTMKYH